GPAQCAQDHDRNRGPNGRCDRGASRNGRRSRVTFQNVAIIGLGLLGGSIGLAVADNLPHIATTGYDEDSAVRTRARERGLVGKVCDSATDAVANADLVILCVPVGAMEGAAREMAPALKPNAV